MTDKKLTPLFPMSVKPRRNGVYQLLVADGDGEAIPMYSRWCFGRWNQITVDIKIASVETRPSMLAIIPGEVFGWRGLAEDPKKG